MILPDERYYPLENESLGALCSRLTSYIHAKVSVTNNNIPPTKVYSYATIQSVTNRQRHRASNQT